MSEVKTYCDNCIHKEVCGKEGCGDSDMTFCDDKIVKMKRVKITGALYGEIPFDETPDSYFFPDAIISIIDNADPSEWEIEDIEVIEKVNETETN